MSFNTIALGPADQGTVFTLSPIIIQTLRKASQQVSRGQATALIDKWFGDTAQPWVNRLGPTLNRLASVINVQDITVTFRALKHREGAFAVAPKPAGGWNDYTSVSGSQGQNFRIQLDTDWNTAPLYRPGNTPADSMFQTLVHECTHLILDTNDHVYGANPCLQLARTSSYRAKDNADNWGYFIEEFR